MRILADLEHAFDAGTSQNKVDLDLSCELHQAMGAKRKGKGRGIDKQLNYRSI